MNKNLTTGELISEVDSLLIKKKQLENEIKGIFPFLHKSLI